ncbi:MAG TPA: hypothetical protein VFU14_06690 [Acidimicrobiales bacterium]|nr:hypothetical protein [Acidimicrobiales bacterium]
MDHRERGTVTARIGRQDVEIDLAADAALRAAVDDLARGDVTQQLEAAQRLRHAAEALVAELVAEARKKGATWSDIGDTLGVSTQAAHQKYRWVAGKGQT